MGDRFRGMRIPRFDEALRVAREQGIGLDLDIKTKGIAPLLLESLEREGMLQRVIFGGEWQDVKALYPEANRDPVAWVEPGCIQAQVAELQHQGKFVVANFSGNAHEMDLAAMREAVAAGVDALNVDYPRLAADAVGRPVEARRLQAGGAGGDADDVPLSAACSHGPDGRLRPHGQREHVDLEHLPPCLRVAVGERAAERHPGDAPVTTAVSP